MIRDVLKLSWNVPGPPKPNPSPFSMTKINVTDSINFVTNSIATSYIDDVEDDVVVDLSMAWIAMMMCILTFLLTWQ